MNDIISNYLKTFAALIAFMLSFAVATAQDISLDESDAAPDFSLQADNGDWVKLSDFKGKNVVLYFYPKDLSSGCTKEACNFRDNLSKITDMNAVILGVSVDSVDSHKQFKESDHLNFTLLADPGKTVTMQYAGLNSSGMANRITFVIDKEGFIKRIFHKVDVNEHYKDVIAVLQGM